MDSDTSAALNMLTLYQIKKQMLHITFYGAGNSEDELSGHHAFVSKVELHHMNSVMVSEYSEYYDPNPLPRVTFRIGENRITFQVHSGSHRMRSLDPNINGLRLDLGSDLELRVFRLVETEDVGDEGY